MQETLCKFVCEMVTRTRAQPGEMNEEITLRTHYDPNLVEDQRFTVATPSGEMKFRITNPRLEGFFVPGQVYMIRIGKG